VVLKLQVLVPASQLAVNQISYHFIFLNNYVLLVRVKH
jgi:hypothetical protein